MRKNRIHLPGSVTLLGPGDDLYPLGKQRADAGKHVLHIGDPTGTGGTIVGTLDELAMHVGEAASLIFPARAALRDTEPDDRAIVVDREKLTAWADEWVQGEFGDAFAEFGPLTGGDVRELVTALNDAGPDDTGWSTHPEVKAVVASTTDNGEVIPALDVAAGFRLAAPPTDPWDLRTDDRFTGIDLVASIAEHIAGLLNEQWAAYRAAR